jgi:hypothetical protein
MIEKIAETIIEIVILLVFLFCSLFSAASAGYYYAQGGSVWRIVELAVISVVALFLGLTYAWFGCEIKTLMGGK